MSDPRYAKVGTPQTRLIEECAELIHILCKARRFGLDSCHPDDLTKTNSMLILEEIADVEKAIAEVKDLMEEHIEGDDEAEEKP